MNASVPESHYRQQYAWLELLGLLLILSLAAYLRLANLGSNPGWYSDEGTLINIADNLAHGRWQYLSINQSTLLVARLPLFVGLLGGLFRLFGTDITILRAFTACLGVLSVLLVYLLVRRVQKGGESWLALLSALMLAIYPQAVLYSRLGFSYNLLALLVLVASLGLWAYLETGLPAWLVVACLAVGLGSVTDLSMLMFIPPVALVLSTRGWRTLLQGLLWTALPGAVYTIWMLATVPQAFLFDLRFTLSRLGSIPLLLQLPVILLNYYYMLVQDVWFLVGVAGLFLLRPLRWRYLIMTLFFLPLVSLGRTTGFAISWEYYLIPFFPLVAIGAASLVWAAVPTVLHTLQGGLRALWQAWGFTDDRGKWLQARAAALLGSLGLFMIVISPLLISLIFTLQGIRDGMSTRIDPVLVNARDARQAVAYVNQRVAADDLVIASPAVAWLFHSQAADFQHSLAAEGVSTIHLPGDIPPDRFVFDPRYTQARYVMIDRIWRNWALANIPEVEDMLDDVEAWQREYTVGEFEIYRNPDR